MRHARHPSGWRFSSTKLLGLISIAIAGCGGDTGNSANTGAKLPALTNQPPTISGDPPVMATVGSPWSFSPVARDPDGDELTFEGDQIPDWLTLDPANGSLQGVPSDSDIGTWSGIVILVSDGIQSVSLTAFDVSVVAQGTASGWARLQWTPPEQRQDGSPVGLLSGYSIYYGNQSGTYDHIVKIANPGVTSYLIEGLGEGTWYFAMTALTDDGLESELSAEVSKTVTPCEAGAALTSC